jgi:hypothetical protein
MIRRPLSFALVPVLLGSQLVSAEAQTPAPTQPARATAQAPAPVEPAQTVALPADPVEAREVRDRLHELLRQYPPSLAEILRLDPSLLTSDAYVATYPALRAFVAQHPEVVRNPAYFFGTEHVRSWEDYGPRAEAVRVWGRVVEGFQIFTVMSLVVGGIVWLVKQLIDHRRWLRQSKVQTEVHTKLLDRFSSNEDLLAYIQSPTGRKFLESAPIAIEADAPARQVGAPFGRIFWSVQAGTVLLLTGLGLQFIGQRQQWEEIAQPLWSMGILVVAVGLGFLISAGASYFLSRRLGLLPAYNGKHDVPARHDAL